MTAGNKARTVRTTAVEAQFKLLSRHLLGGGANLITKILRQFVSRSRFEPTTSRIQITNSVAATDTVNGLCQ